LASDERVTDLTKQIAELRLAIDNTEKERDFYYTKLLEIEEIVQRNRGDPAADLISKILVAGSEDDSTAADVVASESSATSAVSEPEPAVEEDAEEY
jgi:RP/EB family microtubule-associated protein